MLTWNEIDKLIDIDRRQYEEEWRYRKVYEKSLLTIDKLYDYFLLWCWSKEYFNIGNTGAHKAWKQFCSEIDNIIVKEWIELIEHSLCAKDLQEYFNSKVKNTPIYVYKGE